MACSPNLVVDINHLERIQMSTTRFIIGIRHLPYEERLQRLRLNFLQLQPLWADLITAFKISTGRLDVDPNMFFFRLGHPYTVLQLKRDRWTRGSVFSVSVAKDWNKYPAFVVTAPSDNIFKKRCITFGQKSFFISPC